MRAHLDFFSGDDPTGKLFKNLNEAKQALDKADAQQPPPQGRLRKNNKRVRKNKASDQAAVETWPTLSTLLK